MKKFLSLLLVAVLLVTFLSACKKNDALADGGSLSYNEEYSAEIGQEGSSASKGEGSEVDVTVKSPSGSDSSSDKEEGSVASKDSSKSTPDCSHYDYKTVVKQEWGCETDEHKTHICNLCYFTWEEKKAAKGHTIVIDPAVAPTYTSTGLTEGSHCSDCGKVIVKQKTVSKLSKYETPVMPLD